MVRRTANAPSEEPEQSNFQLPSEGVEHLFQVVDKWEDDKDANVIIVKLEVVGGEEEGRSILNRVGLDDSQKSFYYSRLFLKAIGEPYKGQFTIDDDNWIGRQFYASVVHAEGKNGKKYGNIDQYNYEKQIEQFDSNPSDSKPQAKGEPEPVNWDD